jgi:Fe-Mn family superoxide dismutase
MLRPSYSTQEVRIVSVPGNQFIETPEAARQTYPFTLGDLPYSYAALEPHLDQKTLQVHHRGHHAAYVKKLNEALKKAPELQKLTLLELLSDLSRVPQEIRTAVKNNGGGHLNHDIFWNSMTPESPNARPPDGALAEALKASFGSVEAFREKFSQVAAAHFASGWVALAADPGSRKLEIVDLEDHEIVAGKPTLLILDVWEHAYYGKYQNKRPEFIDAFWNVANWSYAAEIFQRSAR